MTLCEHVFVSTKGGAARWFEGSVRRGDLAGALSELDALPRPVTPLYALGLVVLLGEARDPRHGRWAARWAGRLALEQATVDLAALGQFVAELSAAAAAGRAGPRAAR